jgi:hypothetical protein
MGSRAAGGICAAQGTPVPNVDLDKNPSRIRLDERDVITFDEVVMERQSPATRRTADETQNQARFSSASSSQWWSAPRTAIR